MINQATQSRLATLGHRYALVAADHREAVHQISLAELPEQVDQSPAIEKSSQRSPDTG